MMQLKKKNMRNFSKLSVVLCLLFFNGLIYSQNKIKLDGVAAVVGKNIVLESDIIKFQQEVKASNNIEVSKCQILENILEQKLLAHHALVDSVAVTDAEIKGNLDRTLANFKSQIGDVKEVAKLYGFDSEDELRSELTTIEKENLLISKERQGITKNITVTPEEIRFFYNELKSKNQLPTYPLEVELSQIGIHVLPTEEAVKTVLDKLNSIKKEIENGYSMRLKAILYSEDPGVSQNGGQYTLSRDSQFVKEFKEAAFSLEEGEVSEPFKTQFGYHILQVEKVRGQQRDVRHILIRPKVDNAKLTVAKQELEKIKTQLINKELTFEEAVKKYSTDEATKLNEGVLMNPMTNDAKFDLEKMDPQLANHYKDLKEGDFTTVYFQENREGEKSFVLGMLKKYYPSHEANLKLDYAKIQELALQDKQQKAIDTWVKSKIKDSYIRINESYKDCDYKYKWQ